MYTIPKSVEIIAKNKKVELEDVGPGTNNMYIIYGVECKSNGKLDKEEKEKCKWLLSNNIFSKILIASKGKKRGSIDYKQFEN